jgi:IS30 family transposase
MAGNAPAIFVSLGRMRRLHLLSLLRVRSRLFRSAIFCPLCRQEWTPPGDVSDRHAPHSTTPVPNQWEPALRTGGSIQTSSLLIRRFSLRRQLRRSRYAKQTTDRRGHIRDAVSISERPACVEDRAVPGHWEGDLLCGPNNSFIVTLVERHSRYVMLAKVSSRRTETVVNALIRQSKKLPDELYKSLTWDRGHELADHKRFKMETDIDVYFCDPQSPWQRGSNENTNRLLRQYLPKGTDLSVHSQVHLNTIARQLNERPRKTLQFETPAEKFNQCVAMTG